MSEQLPKPNSTVEFRQVPHGCTAAERALIEAVIASYAKPFTQCEVSTLDACVRAVQAERRAKEAK